MACRNAGLAAMRCAPARGKGVPATIEKAAVPVLGTLVWQAFGSYDGFVICALVGTLVVVTCF